MNKKTWSEFRKSGLGWAVNNFLHLFGWVIVWEEDEKTGEVVACYPARSIFRGFSTEDNDEGFMALHKHLKENIGEVYEETMGD